MNPDLRCKMNPEGSYSRYLKENTATAIKFQFIDTELERDLMRIWVCPELLYDIEGNLIGMETLKGGDQV